MASGTDESSPNSDETKKNEESVLLERRELSAGTHEAPPLEHESYFKRFLHHDMVGSGFLLFAGVAAVIIANGPFVEQYHHFWETPLGISFGDGGGFQKSLHHWVNDGLMSIFFFLVGLEIKRELLAGELNDVRKAMLPAAAAVGGMIVPALIFAAFNAGKPSAAGWGIPMATDIAFAAGCIALLRKWVPLSLMVFLVALAIVDDLGAVTVIALFYTEKIAVGPLVVGGSLIVLSFCMGQLGIRRTWPYVVIGIIIWFAFLESGIHATIAGVLLAFTIPEKARYHTHNFRGRMETLIGKFDDAEKLWDDDLSVVETDLKDLMVNHAQQGLIRRMNDECHFVEAPLQRIEHNIEPFSVFVIMPIFAFANAGVHLELSHLGEMIKQPITLGIIFGLFIGKPLGIVLASFVMVKLGFASLPRGVTWAQLTGVGFLAGIGFTMSLFVNELAFLGIEPEQAEELISSGKIGIFIASILSAVVGLVWLKVTCKDVQD
ncbi:MAG TPA: Na+/H+ antiporter NhaA [Candidatus Hydrogenedentes bacterium]|nr:Na+/H+ antiporter NhaA [Candidatus Hydrogenedentota bacterium]